MRRLEFFCVLFMLGFSGALSAATAAPSPGQSFQFSDSLPAWFNESLLEVSDDLAESAAAGKRLLLYFGQDFCPYCERFHQHVLTQGDIHQQLQQQFQVLAFNIVGDVEWLWTDGKSYTEKALASKLKVQFTPTFLLLDEKGKEIGRVGGYLPPDRFRLVLRYASEKKENTIGFADYLRAAIKNADAKPASLPPLAQAIAAPYREKSVQKPRLVLVEQAQCPLCEEWRRDFFATKKAQRLLQKFELITIDLHSNRRSFRFANGIESEADWSRRHQVGLTPALLLFNAQNKEIIRADTYFRPFHLSSILSYVAEGAYARQPNFQRFLNERTDAARQNKQPVQIW